MVQARSVLPFQADKLEPPFFCRFLSVIYACLAAYIILPENKLLTRIKFKSYTSYVISTPFID